MSRVMSYDELHNHIDSSINELANYLDDLNNNSNKHQRKRGMLISYWIKDYVNFCKNEDSFFPPNRRYKRGDIVLVNFGYRVGSELGGRHFAVVLDCNNTKRSPILTVVPLSSKREGYKKSFYSFELEQGIENLYIQKRESLFDTASESLVQIKELREQIYSLENSSITKREQLKNLEKLVEKTFKKVIEIDNLDKETKKLKKGTIVSVSQITTISKQRIINPKNNRDSLSGIRLNSKDLDTLNEYISNLFIYTKKI